MSDSPTTMPEAEAEAYRDSLERMIGAQIGGFINGNPGLLAITRLGFCPACSVVNIMGNLLIEAWVSEAHVSREHDSIDEMVESIRKNLHDAVEKAKSANEGPTPVPTHDGPAVPQ